MNSSCARLSRAFKVQSSKFKVPDKRFNRKEPKEAKISVSSASPNFNRVMPANAAIQDALAGRKIVYALCALCG
jgi:hypothetical protein